MARVAQRLQVGEVEGSTAFAHRHDVVDVGGDATADAEWLLV
jgi:hypothetical protein